MEQSHQYYFAYGSNLNIKQMRYHCPRAKRVGTSILEGYRLSFNGSGPRYAYLTIEPCEGSFVPIGVYSINSQDEARLDHYECYPSLYDKEYVSLILNGTKITGLIYIMHSYLSVNVPSNSYFSICLQGYKDFNFDQKLLIESLIRAKEATDKKLSKNPLKKDC